MAALVVPAPPSDASPFECLDEAHRDIMRQLDELATLASTLEGSSASPAQRERARTLADWFGSEARLHHVDEEQHVFPPLLSSGNDRLSQAALRLIQDHGWLDTDWSEISPILAAIAEGQAWFDPAVLRHAVDVFRQLYLDHIVLEESVAYPEARSRMTPTRLEAMDKDMARRRAQREARGVRR